MAGSGVEVRWNDREITAILQALSAAAMPDLKKIADFAGAELDYISKGAFENEKDPVTGDKWKDLKHPKTNGTILRSRGQLERSLDWEAFGDGSVVYGSNMVYARIHYKGGKAGKGLKTPIPARPYKGVPDDFDRRILSDPTVVQLLGMAAGGDA